MKTLVQTLNESLDLSQFIDSLNESLPTIKRDERFINDPNLLMPDKPNRYHGVTGLVAYEKYKKELEEYILYVSKKHPDLKTKAEKELVKVNKKIKELL